MLKQKNIYDWVSIVLKFVRNIKTIYLHWKFEFIYIKHFCLFASEKPSTTCGPFTHQETSYVIVTELIQSWQKKSSWLVDIINFISSSGFIAALLGILLWVYYMLLMKINAILLNHIFIAIEGVSDS